MHKAIDFARWFIKKGCDWPRNSRDGNMRLQKMLYFSQLIHLARTGEVLFEDPIFAFQNGSVIEDVRLAYKENFAVLIEESYSLNLQFSSEQEKTVQTAEALFCDLRAKELSELNHLHHSWKKAFEKSCVHGSPQKILSTISVDDIKQYDLGKIKEMLIAYDMAKGQCETFEVINGSKFYYNPSELILTEEILEALELYCGTGESYSIYIDETLGMVVS